MDKEIQEILNILITCTEEKDCATFKFCDPCKARNLYNAGYRKADEVRKEILKEVGNIYICLDEDNEELYARDFGWYKTLCKKYGVEIDE